MAKRQPGNPNTGLLREIIKIFQMHEFDYPLCTKYVTKELLRSKHWGDEPHKTPGQSVNSYCSQNPQIFRHTDRDEYILERDWYYQTR